MLHVKRIYDEPASTDGFRVLVDRLWPRGLSKERARIDLWATHDQVHNHALLLREVLQAQTA